MARSFICLAALAAASAAHAADLAEVPICVARFEAQGLRPRIAREAERALIRQLAEVGGVIPPGAGRVDLPASCFDDPACLVDSAEGLEVAGLLHVRLMRVGPMVRMTLRSYDAATGNSAIEIEASAPMKRFPDTPAVHAALERALDALRALSPQQETTAAVTTDRSEPPSPTPTAVPPDDEPRHEKPAEMGAVSAAPTADGEGDTTSAGDVIWPMFGWGLAGLGGIAAISGAVSAGIGYSIHSGLSDTCPDGRCPTDQQDQLQTDVGTVNLLRILSPSLLGAGAALAAVGALVLLVAGGAGDEEGDSG